MQLELEKQEVLYYYGEVMIPTVWSVSVLIYLFFVTSAESLFFCTLTSVNQSIHRLHLPCLVNHTSSLPIITTTSIHNILFLSAPPSPSPLPPLLLSPLRHTPISLVGTVEGDTRPWCDAPILRRAFQAAISCWPVLFGYSCCLKQLLESHQAERRDQTTCDQQQNVE